MKTFKKGLSVLKEAKKVVNKVKKISKGVDENKQKSESKETTSQQQQQESKVNVQQQQQQPISQQYSQLEYSQYSQQNYQQHYPQLDYSQYPQQQYPQQQFSQYPSQYTQPYYQQQYQHQQFSQYPQPNYQQQYPQQQLSQYPQLENSQYPQQQYSQQQFFQQNEQTQQLSQIDSTKIKKLQSMNVPGFSFNNLLSSLCSKLSSTSTSTPSPTIPNSDIIQLDLNLQQIQPTPLQMTQSIPSSTPSSTPNIITSPSSSFPYLSTNLLLTHEHQLVQMVLPSSCTSCSQLSINEIGFGCNKCKFYLCQSCYFTVRQKHPNSSLHSHQLTPKLLNSWTCTSCHKRILSTDKLSFHCSQCSFNYCLKCFFTK